jgi:hypothetical protein
MPFENVEGPLFYERLVAAVEDGKQVGVCMIEHPTQTEHTAVFASIIPIKNSKVLVKAAYKGDMQLRTCVALATILRARESARKMHLQPLPST